MNWGSRSLRALLSLLVALSCTGVQAEELLDLRASFPRIEPYTKPPSSPVAREFSIPGPGTLEITTTFAPWFRSTAPVRFLSSVPIDGRDESAWVEHVPGVESIGSRSEPERWVDGSGLTIVSTYRVNKARPKLQAGLFPSVVRYGDGSFLQLANSVQVTVRWQPGSRGAASTGDAVAGAGLLGGAAMPCEARAGGKTWPCTVQITRRDERSGAFEGTLEWKSLGSLHRIRGTVQGNQMRFTEVEALRPGGAHLNVDYVMTLHGEGAEGRYTDRGDGSSGQMRIGG